MRLIAALVTVATAVVCMPFGVSAGMLQQRAVVELFTSQGCSSCPPADKLFEAYARRPDLVAISLPVDYWDFLGWKDTLASPKHAARQRAYAAALGIGNVYTPQIVVSGTRHAVGSRKAEVDAAIDAASAGAGAQVPVEARRTASGLQIVVGNGAAGASAPATGTTPGTTATVWLAVVAPRVEVTVQRGENRGRKLTYLNVVRNLTPIGMYSGRQLTLELPAGAIEGKDAMCAVLVQEGEVGRIIGAAWMKP